MIYILFEQNIYSNNAPSIIKVSYDKQKLQDIIDDIHKNQPDRDTEYNIEEYLID